jgi:hypothetical protein
MVPLRLPTFVS